MKLIPFIALVALGAIACNDGTPALQVGNGYVPSAECEVSAGVAQAGGSLDIAGGIATNTRVPYLLGFALSSNLLITEVQAGGQDVSGSVNDASITISEISLSYEASAGNNPDDYTYASYFIVPPGAGDTSFLVLNLLSPGAYDAAVAALTANPTVPYTLRVTMQLKGTSGAGSKVESNEVVYDIEVTRSGFTCSPGTVTASGPCGTVGGQDGAQLTCTPPAP